MRIAIIILLLYILLRSIGAQSTDISPQRGVIDSLCYVMEKRYEIKFPIVALAQATWETDWFSSKIYRESKNRYGMKHNKRGFSKKEYLGHAFYENEDDSYKDYAAWQRKVLSLRPDVDTEEEYIDLLDNLPTCKGCRYAEDKTYTSKIRARIRVLRALN